MNSFILKELFKYVSETIKTLPREEIVEGDERVVYTLEEKKDEFNISQEKDIYVVTGKAIERLIGRINIDDNESMYYFHKCLKTMGVEEALKKAGVKEGDIVKFVDYEFEWYE